MRVLMTTLMEDGRSKTKNEAFDREEMYRRYSSFKSDELSADEEESLINWLDDDTRERFIHFRINGKMTYISTSIITIVEILE